MEYATDTARQTHCVHLKSGLAQAEQATLPALIQSLSTRRARKSGLFGASEKAFILAFLSPETFR